MHKALLRKKERKKEMFEREFGIKLPTKVDMP